MTDGQLQFVNNKDLNSITTYFSEQEFEFVSDNFIDLTTSLSELKEFAQNYYAAFSNARCKDVDVESTQMLTSRYRDTLSKLTAFEEHYRKNSRVQNRDFMNKLGNLIADIKDDMDSLNAMNFNSEATFIQELTDKQAPAGPENDLDLPEPEMDLSKSEVELPGLEEVMGQNRGDNFKLFEENKAEMPFIQDDDNELPDQDEVDFNKQFKQFGPNMELYVQEENRRYMQAMTTSFLTDKIAPLVKNGSKQLINDVNKLQLGLKNLHQYYQKFTPLNRNEDSIIPNADQIAMAKTQTQAVLEQISICKNNFVKEKIPAEAKFYMTLVEEKMIDDFQVLNKMVLGSTFSEAANKHTKLMENFGLIQGTMEVLPYDGPQNRGPVQEQNAPFQRQNAPAQKQNAPAQNLDASAPVHNAPAIKQGKHINKDVIAELVSRTTKLLTDIKKADPFYMWSGSSKYTDVKTELGKLNSFAKKFYEKLDNGQYDLKSPEFKKDYSDLTKLINSTMNNTVHYLDKKNNDRLDDLDKGINRVEDPGRQKYEQPRIMATLNAYAHLQAISMKMGMKQDLIRDDNAKTHCNNLLSVKSKLKYNAQIQREMAANAAPKQKDINANKNTNNNIKKQNKNPMHIG